MNPVEISELLRRRVLADLHLGRLRPGTRLPSLRIVARELGVSVRAVARAYDRLAAEGLVTVRGRSGIYLAEPQSVEIDLQEPFDWYAEMMRGAWQRRIKLGELTGMLQQLVSNPLRAACVESTEDTMVAFCSELADDFALETTAVQLTPAGAMVDDEVMPLYEALSAVDFIVTTAFHAAEVRAVAELLKKPIVLASVNETLVDALERQLAEHPITVVAQDPAFVNRFRTYLAERFNESGDMRVVHLDEVTTNPACINGTKALYTRAARRRLQEEEFHLLPPPIPFLSAAAARRVVHCMLSTHAKRTPHAA